VFPYGYYYAQHLVLIGIVLVFASTVPMITIGGFLFFGMRHLIDSYNILTVNRKEINFSSSMFRKILLTLQFAVLLLQLAMISYLSQGGYMSCCAFLGLSLCISIVVMILSNKSLFDISKQDPSIFNDDEV